MASPFTTAFSQRPALTAGLMAIVLFMVTPHNSYAKDDHYRARTLVEQGEVLPLEQVLRMVNPDNKMRLLEAELEDEDGRWVYEFELIDKEGRVRELEVDARNGTLLEEEIEDEPSHRKQH